MDNETRNKIIEALNRASVSLNEALDAFPGLQGLAQDDADAYTTILNAKDKVDEVAHEIGHMDRVEDSWELPGEDRIEISTGSWQWFGIRFADGRTGRAYYHFGCDAFTDHAGRCVMCGAASPAAT